MSYYAGFYSYYFLLCMHNRILNDYLLLTIVGGYANNCQLQYGSLMFKTSSRMLIYCHSRNANLMCMLAQHIVLLFPHVVTQRQQTINYVKCLVYRPHT